MKNEWILDVLSDLRNFAQQNNLIALAEQLDDTSLVAAAELVSGNRCELRTAVGDAKKARSVY